MQQKWSLMGWACGVVQVELGDLKWKLIWKCCEYARLLGWLQVRSTNAMANDNGNGNGNEDGDEEQWADVTIDTYKSRRGWFYVWRFHHDSTVQFWRWPALGRHCMCQMWWLDGGHCGSGEMEDSVTFDVCYLASLLICLLDYLCTCFDLSPVQIVSAWVLIISGDKSSIGGISPCARLTEGLRWVVLIGCGTYGCVLSSTLNSFLIIYFRFLLLYGFIQPSKCAPEETDNVMAWLHVTWPGPGITHHI